MKPSARRKVSNSSRRTKLIVGLSTAFAVAALMGTGPGLFLINPDPADPDATFVVLGMPVMYVWVVLWFIIQASVVLLAYFLLWGRETDDRPGPHDTPADGVP
jgi:hypothetical protein